MAEVSASESKILIPNATFMDAHGDIRIEPAFQNVVLSLTGEGVKAILSKWEALGGGPSGPVKKAKKPKVSELESVMVPEGPPAPLPAPLPPLSFAEKALEVFRFDPRIATQVDCVGGTIGGKAVKSIPSGRKAGLSHKGHCGLAWEDHPGELSISMLTEEGRGLTIMDAKGDELVFQLIPSLMVARTQKAKGLSALHAGQSGLSVAGFVLAQDWVQLLSAWRLLRGMTKEKIFVRACPVRPRHGFVDSRVIADEQALLALHDETLAADPLGEWLLGEMINAKANVIGTPMALSVGKGHDGATAGVDAITLPLANPLGMRLCDMPEATREKASIAEPEVPYVEVVTTEEKKAFLTQLRAGLATPRSVDFIPQTFRVLRVIRAEGSHLKWEDDMRELGGGRAVREGVVVDHFGGGTVSHYSLHAIGNGVPLVTSHTPMVGEVLESSLDAQIPYDTDALRAGVLAYYATPGRDIRKILCAAIYGFHQAAWLRGSASYILGWCCACIHHAGTMAVAGECRHTHSNRKWDGPGEPAVVQGFLHPGMDRRAVFDAIMKDPWKTRDALRRSTRVLRSTPWSGSYGGTLWDLCLKATIRLDDALHALMDGKAGEPEVANAIGVTNQLLHLAHNNGWWLNKFVNQEIMDLPYWRGDQGWLLPKLLSLVVPGMESMLDRGESGGLAKAKALWAEPRVPEDIRALKPVWPHRVSQIQLLVRGEVPSDDTPTPVFVHLGWNFGKGIAAKWEMKGREILALRGGAGANEQISLDLPVWMRGESKESRLVFGSLPIPYKTQEIGKTHLSLTTQGVAFGLPIPLIGFDNDVHESLLAEATTYGN